MHKSSAERKSHYCLHNIIQTWKIVLNVRSSSELKDGSHGGNPLLSSFDELLNAMNYSIPNQVELVKNILVSNIKSIIFESLSILCHSNLPHS